MAQSDRTKKVVLWVGCHAHTTDIELGKKLARKVMYFEYKLPMNAQLMICNEAEIYKKTKGAEEVKEVDDSASAAMSLSPNNSTPITTQAKQELDRQKALQDLLEILHTGE